MGLTSWPFYLLGLRGTFKTGRVPRGLRPGRWPWILNEIEVSFSFSFAFLTSGAKSSLMYFIDFLSPSFEGLSLAGTMAGRQLKDFRWFFLRECIVSTQTSMFLFHTSSTLWRECKWHPRITYRWPPGENYIRGNFQKTYCLCDLYWLAGTKSHFTEIDDIKAKS